MNDFTVETCEHCEAEFECPVTRDWELCRDCWENQIPYDPQDDHRAERQQMGICD